MDKDVNVAIMQPYFFPYLGYFQLISCADKFVFYDDVDFIKQGWINRNNILVSGKKKRVTISCSKISSNSKIKDIELSKSAPKEIRKLLKTIKQSYRKAPYFENIMPLIESILEKNNTHISDLAIQSVSKVCDYLDINTQFFKSSKDFEYNEDLNKTERIVSIVNAFSANQYINMIGGKKLYNKKDFEKSGVTLSFLKPNLAKYNQFKGEFIPGLSIIDILMFNDKKKINKMLSDYEVE
jgi:hypothetical protein